MHAVTHFRRTARSTIVILAAMLLLALAACGPRSASFPTGTFTTTIPEEAIGGKEFMANLIGDWQLTFTPEGKYTLVNKGVDIARGSYSAEGEQITFTEESGIGVEPGNTSQSRYSWSLAENTLTFSPIDDTLEDRRIVMSSHPWTPAP